MLTDMPYDGIYKIQHFSSFSKNAELSFPLALHNVPAGNQGMLNFHEHDSIEIAIITAGEGIHILNDKKARIKKGDVLIIYPGMCHAYDETQTLGVLNILYDPERMVFPAIDGYEIPLFCKFFPMGKISTTAIPPEPVIHLSSEEAIKKIITESLSLDKVLKERAPGNLLHATVKFLDIILAILHNGTKLITKTKTTAPPVFQEVLKYINENFTGEIRLRDLYEMAYCSCRSFELKFKKITGFSPAKYILKKRIALATTLLLKENLSVNDICGLCGFLDRSYFTLQFRKITGFSPREYRKKHLQQHTIN